MIYVKHSDIRTLIKLNDLDVAALFIACIIHDFKHPGVTNVFLVNKGDKIAIKYNGNIY
jgi:hypothetical protein